MSSSWMISYIVVLISVKCRVWLLPVMKSFILSASILSVFVGLTSCEKHEWDKTKQLYESHDAHGHDDHSGHGHGHDKHTEKGHGDKSEHAGDVHAEIGHSAPAEKKEDHSGHGHDAPTASGHEEQPAEAHSVHPAH